MAQPPLSQQIKQLEQELGVKLFDRTRPQIQLTLAGHELMAQVHAIFNDVETAVRETRRVAQGKKGKLTIGISPSPSFDLLPKIIREYRVQYPEVDLELRELTGEQQLEALKQEQIQAGFLRTPFDHEIIESQVLYHVNLLVALPADHPASAEDVIVLADLRNEPFIMSPRKLSPPTYDEIIALCRNSGFSPNIVLEVAQVQTIINLVASGLGIAIMSESVKTAQLPGVVYRPLLETTGHYIAVAWRKDNNTSLLRNFLSVTNDTVLTEHEFNET